MTTDVLEATDERLLLVATFALGDAWFGIDTAIVQEVVLPGEITLVHHAPEHVAGIRNLRGHIITVIDLRVALGLGCITPGLETRILIVDWQDELVGLLVDSLADTVSVDLAALAPPPPNVHGTPGRGLRGVIQSEAHLIALLDPAVLLDTDSQ